MRVYCIGVNGNACPLQEWECTNCCEDDIDKFVCSGCLDEAATSSDDDDEDAVEDITARFPTLMGDPQFRTVGHTFLGREYEYTAAMEGIDVDIHRGKVIGFISKNDLDSKGIAAFTSGITGKAEDLFHLCGVDKNGDDYTFDLEKIQMQDESFTWIDKSGNDENEDDEEEEEEELESGDEDIIDGAERGGTRRGASLKSRGGLEKQDDDVSEEVDNNNEEGGAEEKNNEEGGDDDDDDDDKNDEAAVEDVDNKEEDDDDEEEEEEVLDSGAGRGG